MQNLKKNEIADIIKQFQKDCKHLQGLENCSKTCNIPVCFAMYCEVIQDRKLTVNRAKKLLKKNV